MKIVPSLSVGLVALAGIETYAGENIPPANAPYRDANLPIERRVQDLLGRMALEEKIAQLSQKFSDGVKMDGDEADVASLQKLFGDRSPGVLFGSTGGDIEPMARRLAACQKYLREKTRLGIPSLTANEALHGVLAKGATVYPQFIALGCTWNPALALEMGAQIAQEASAAGLSQVLAPLVEVPRDPRWAAHSP